MKQFIHQNKTFLTLYLLFLISGAVIISIFEKGDEIIYFNSLHNSFFNTFFKWVTKLAEFPAFVLIIFYAFLSNFGKGFLIWININFVFLATSIFKYILFPNEIRPAVFFEGKVLLNFVEGVEIAHYNSFPSGHTATAFAVFFMLSILNTDKRWSAFFFTLALLIGVSRVYLMQHFLRDVYFGSLLAVSVTIAVWFIIAQSKWFNNLSWKDKAVLK